MQEVLRTIIEVIRDFIGAFIFFGALCVTVFGFWDFLSARRRWRNQKRCPDDYSRYTWPGDSRLGRYACFFRVNGCLFLAFAAFTTTFMVASIAAAMLPLILTGGSLPLCLAVFVPALIISGCAGYFGQCLLDEVENQMLECADVISIVRHSNRRTRRARRPILGHAQLTR